MYRVGPVKHSITQNRPRDVYKRQLPAYAGLPTVKIDTTGRTPAEVAAQIAAL